MDIESIISYGTIGIISVLFGALCINLILSKEQRVIYNTFKTYIIFFFIGIILHILVQTVNLDQIYCDKQCQMRLSK
jgi:uncharacterized membrane protein